MQRLRIADQHALQGEWTSARDVLLSMQRDFPASLLVHLRLGEICRLLGDTLGHTATQRAVAALRTQRDAQTRETTVSNREWPPTPADVTIVDPIFRGSRLYYSAMLCEAVTSTVPGATVNLLTRRNPESSLLPSYRERLRSAKLFSQLAVPPDLWYGSVSDAVCGQIVEAMIAARPGSVFALSGWTELLPNLAKKLQEVGRHCPVHLVGYEYAAGTLQDLQKRQSLQQISSLVLSVGCWLLDESFDCNAAALPGVQLAVLPDPIPYRRDDPLLAAARKSRSTFIDAEPKGETRPLALLAVGLQSSRKGLRDLIRAARVIEQRSLPIRIHVSGKLADGETHLGLQVNALKVAMRSRAEYVDDAEILSTYNTCDAVLLPYARDFSGSSGVFAHAMAFGKPVIATEHGCVGWRTREFQVGLTYPAGDADALVTTIGAMLAWSPDDWQRYRGNCNNYYRRNSYEEALNALGQLFSKLGVGAVPKATAPSIDERADEVQPRAQPFLKLVASPSETASMNDEPDSNQYALPLAAVNSIRQICLLDTGIGSRNMGDHIIVDSIRQHLRKAFPNAIFVTVPTHEYLGTESLKLLDSADIRLVCGTNLLASHMDEYKQWKIGGLEFAAMRDVTLMGCGWWQYQEAPNRYTELLLSRILSDKTVHSVRDSYTAGKLGTIGSKKVLNTTCPTLWGLTPEHVAQIPKHKARDVITTLTDYKADEARDGFMLEHLASRYRHVYVWIQGTGDFSYLKRICRGLPSNSVHVVPATLEAYDRLLESELDLDYIGTRLHAGVRALQKRRRALILAVDNRAREIAADTDLPCIPREDASIRLEGLVSTFTAQAIKLPTAAIQSWLGQFA